eukprot:4512384-Pleurochrysis_carterae.AAC.1
MPPLLALPKLSQMPGPRPLITHALDLLLLVVDLSTYWAYTLIQFVKSMCWTVTRAVLWQSSEPLPLASYDEEMKRSLHAIVLVAGNMGDASKAARHYAQHLDIPVLAPALGPVSSCHDRACELFYALKVCRPPYSHAPQNS